MIITAILGVYTPVTRQLRVCAMQAGFKEIFAQYKKHKARLKAQQAERRACSGPSISEAEQVLLIIFCTLTESHTDAALLACLYQCRSCIRFIVLSSDRLHMSPRSLSCTKLGMPGNTDAAHGASAQAGRLQAAGGVHATGN